MQAVTCSGTTSKGEGCREFRGLQAEVSGGEVRYRCWRHLTHPATPDEVAEVMSRTFRLPNGQVLRNVHLPRECNGACPIHKPSTHHMRTWPLDWRDDLGVFERICPHGVGHTDPDTCDYLLRIGAHIPAHGCDGCCLSPAERFAAVAARYSRYSRIRRFLRWLNTPLVGR